MKPSLIGSALEKLITARQPAFLWGAPGIGKSAITHQVARSMNLELRDVRACLLDPVDLRGLPHVNGDGRAHWATPDFLPRDGAGVLFLDELNAAPPLVQAACYQLVLDRRLGEYVLPDEWTVLAAGNRESDRAVTHRMPTPLRNRFVHLEVEVDLDDWCRWALKAGLRPEVIAFLRFRPNLLHDFNKDSNAFPSPRSWEFVSRLLATSPGPDIEHALYAGAVGEGAAIEFSGFLRIYRELPSIDGILLNAAAAPVPTSPAALYAVATGLAKRATDSNLQRVVDYANRMPKEYAVLTVRDAVTRDNSLTTTQPFIAWSVANQDVIF